MASSSGPPCRPARCRSRRPRWLICSKESIGGIPDRLGDRRARAEQINLRPSSLWGITTQPIRDSLRRMDADRKAIPDEVAALREALALERTKALEVAAELAVARAKAAEDSALIAQQKLRIAKLERQIYGQRSERSSRLIDQLALTFEELEADATEDELAAERAVAKNKTTTVRGFT